jgi:segregation and condensation protein A
MSFEVKIDVYEGPFDLLLQLIMKQELDIHVVPISQITASYLENIEGSVELDLDSATEFILIAATLLLIKARSLLPRPEEELEMAEESESARTFLVERLIEYKKFSNVADMLEKRHAEHGWYIPRLRELEADYSELYPDPFEETEAGAMAEALMDLLVEWAREGVDISYIAPIRISVGERIEAVKAKLAVEEAVTFSDLIADCGSKMEIIATFLAILELCKRGEATLAQRKIFGEITVKAREGEKSSAA